MADANKQESQGLKIAEVNGINASSQTGTSQR